MYSRLDESIPLVYVHVVFMLDCPSWIKIQIQKIEVLKKQNHMSWYGLKKNPKLFFRHKKSPIIFLYQPFCLTLAFRTVIEVIKTPYLILTIIVCCVIKDAWSPQKRLCLWRFYLSIVTHASISSFDLPMLHVYLQLHT